MLHTGPFNIKEQESQRTSVSLWKDLQTLLDFPYLQPNLLNWAPVSETSSPNPLPPSEHCHPQMAKSLHMTEPCSTDTILSAATGSCQIASDSTAMTPPSIIYSPMAHIRGGSYSSNYVNLPPLPPCGKHYSSFFFFFLVWCDFNLITQRCADWGVKCGWAPPELQNLGGEYADVGPVKELIERSVQNAPYFSKKL